MTKEILNMLGLQDANVDLEKSIITHDKDKTIYHIFLKKPPEVSCPCCGNTKCNVLGYTIKQLDHSVLTLQKSIIKYHSRRFICKVCNKTFETETILVQKGHKTSNATIALVIEAFKSHTSTFSSIARQYFLKTQTVINIFEEYIKCNRLTLPNALCIDEVYTKRMTKNNPYACVFMDFKTKKLIDIVSSRRKDNLSDYFSQISRKERSEVKYIVMDMYDTYKQLATIYFPNAIIAVDSFHVMKNLNFFMDKIRIKIMSKYKDSHAKLVYANDYYYFLKKFSYFFKTHFDNITRKKINIGKYNLKWDKYEIRKYLLSINKDLTEAYLLWERYYEFNYVHNLNTVDDELFELTNDFLNSPFPEFVDFGKMLKRWKVEIKNSFITLDGSRLSNGGMEGVNSRLKCLIKSANGFSNFSHFRNRALFAINKDMPIRL